MYRCIHCPCPYIHHACYKAHPYNQQSLKSTCKRHGISQIIFWIKYDLGQKYYALKVRPNRDSNSWPPDYDSTFHVTEMPALTTWPSATSKHTKVKVKHRNLLNGTVENFKTDVSGAAVNNLYCMNASIWLNALPFVTSYKCLSTLGGSSTTLNRSTCTTHPTRPGFELITSRSWRYISCHWDACSNHLAISDWKPHTYPHKSLRKIEVAIHNHQVDSPL